MSAEDGRTRRLRPLARTLKIRVALVIGAFGLIASALDGGHHALEIGGFCIALAAALAALIHHAVDAPLHRLEERARRFGEGDLESPVPECDLIELNELASDLEAMRSRLDASTREAREQNLRLERAGAVKDHFLVTMSHEVRTPMNGIIGFLQLLLDSGLREDQIELAETSLASARSLLLILGDILDFTQIQSGELVLEPRPTSIHSCLADAAAAARRSARRKGLELEVHVSPGVPEALMLDERKLRKVLAHLASNAVKFTCAGTVGLRASTRALEGNRHRLRLEVHDTGPGIDAERLPSVFDAFTVGEDSNRRGHSGTGIGLAICKNLIDFLGGEIGVESARGVGSSFWITLDVDAVDMGSRPEIPEPPPASAARQDFDRKTTLTVAAEEVEQLIAAGARSLRVLVVEDNPVNQRLTSRILERLGYEVAVAANGAEALEAMGPGDEAFDVVLMDCQMPVMDGYEATRTLRARRDESSKVPVIALTANNVQGAREECLAAGMDDYLTKPLQVARLKDALRRWSDPSSRPSPVRS